MKLRPTGISAGLLCCKLAIRFRSGRCRKFEVGDHSKTAKVVNEDHYITNVFPGGGNPESANYLIITKSGQKREETCQWNV
jgi:hypothetical protein